jgi:transposase-like protein
MDDKIRFLYANGLTRQKIVVTFKEIYDTDVSPILTSKVTNTVLDEIIQWQSRALEPVYPIVYLNCIVVKIRQDKQVISMKFVPWKDDKAVAANLKRVYQSVRGTGPTGTGSSRG